MGQYKVTTASGEYLVTTEDAATKPGLNMVSDAVGQTPLGMAAKGANSAVNGIGRAFDATGIPIPDSVSRGANALFSPARAVGRGVARDFASRFGGQAPTSPMEPERQGSAVDAAGNFLGENAAVAGVTALSPAIGGPAAIMAQQAQSGKVSPLPLLAPATGVARRVLSPIQDRMVPPLLKASKGIPAEASRMALRDPSIMDRPGTSESVQGKAQGIIDAIKEAQSGVGKQFGTAYKEAGMNSPVQNIIQRQKPTFIGKPFDALRGDYHAAISGDLFKSKDAVGAVTEMQPVERLAALTDLKRALQDQAIYPKAGEQLSQTQGAHNAAIKDMAANMDNLRGRIVGGDRLALVDDAFSEMQEIKQRLMSAFRDPYTGQDYLNRILKGNTDWLTSGRNAGRVGAIERVEQLTGKQVLRPALEEMAAAYLKNPDTMGLPSTGLKSIITSLVPTKMFFKRPPANVSGGVGRLGGGLRILSRSREAIANPGQTAVQPERKRDDNRNQNQGQYYANGEPESNGHSTSKRLLKSKPEKVLTEAEAKNYLRKAKGDRSAARRLAIADGWTIPS